MVWVKHHTVLWQSTRLKQASLTGPKLSSEEPPPRPSWSWSHIIWDSYCQVQKKPLYLYWLSAITLKRSSQGSPLWLVTKLQLIISVQGKEKRVSPSPVVSEQSSFSTATGDAKGITVHDLYLLSAFVAFREWLHSTGLLSTTGHSMHRPYCTREQTWL